MANQPTMGPRRTLCLRHRCGPSLINFLLQRMSIRHVGNPPIWNRPLPLCRLLEGDNSGSPLLPESLINVASDSHLLDFPRFLCATPAQRVARASCRAPESILPFPLRQHGFVSPAPSTPERSDGEQQDLASSARFGSYFSV